MTGIANVADYTGRAQPSRRTSASRYGPRFCTSVVINLSTYKIMALVSLILSQRLLKLFHVNLVQNLMRKCEIDPNRIT